MCVPLLLVLPVAFWVLWCVSWLFFYVVLLFAVLLLSCCYHHMKRFITVKENKFIQEFFRGIGSAQWAYVKLFL